MKPIQISSNFELAPGYFLISFPRHFEFLPGQIIKLALSPEDKPRMYSIASGANDPEIRILYDVVHEGYFTPRLAALRPGDTLFHSGPQGYFMSTEEPAWWISAGTGLAPFSSMFFSGMGKNKTIVHGGRWANSFFFQNEFLKENPDHYFRCCSRETGPGLFPGRVTEFLTQREALPLNEKFYLCGGSEFVVDVRDVLIERGVPFEHIFAEIYF